MSITYTTRLKFAVPDFLTEPWHDELRAAFASLDQIVYDAIILQNTTLWLNSTVYAIGNVVISPVDGQLYTAAVAHTSTASPQTFTAEKAAHPTFWVAFAPTIATQAEAEAGIENTHFMTALRTQQAIAALAPPPTGTVPRDGRMKVASGTALEYKPFLGNSIMINGVVYTIPTAGIVGLGNTGVYVNGVPGQNLAANTTYLVSAFVTGGVVTGSFRTVFTHGPNAPFGVECPTGVPTETVIGLIFTQAAALFQDDVTTRYIRSWFNDPGISAFTQYSTTRFTASAVYAEIDAEIRLNWVSWAGESFSFLFDGNTYSDAVSNGELSITVDTVVQEAWSFRNYTVAFTILNQAALALVTPTEGKHTASVVGRVTAGNLYVHWVAGTPGNRSKLRMFKVV